MFDYRYHALSLVAVFLALAIGLLLGVTIGDQELVSSAREDVRDSLRADVEEANARSDELRSDIERRRRFEREAYPLLVGGQLQGRQIGLVFLGSPSEDTVTDVRDALEPAGAELGLVAALREPVSLAAVAERAEGTRYEDLADDVELVEPFGRRVGVQLVEGGRLVGEVRPSLLRSFTGEAGDLDGVVVVRRPIEAEEDAARDIVSALSDGMASGLTATGVPVVGVERSDVERSQVGWHRERGLSTVDNLDTVAGRAAMIFTLAGAEGSFGFAEDAQALLPPVVGRVSAPE